MTVNHELILLETTTSNKVISSSEQASSGIGRSSESKTGNAIVGDTTIYNHFIDSGLLEINT